VTSGGIDLSSLPASRASLKAKLPGWAPGLLELVDACDTVTPRPIVALPIGHRWPHREGLTLLGDAAHVMPPFSGEGVNMAMLDATELALRLAADSNWSRAVVTYEEAMFTRATEAAAGAMEGMAFVSEDGLAHVLEHFQSLANPES
jgi:2-polyprenyl-6-methoxyphenol hydroxylase-like FAD-dependent oxidoreductase